MKQYPKRPTDPDCECGHWKITHKDGRWLINTGECRLCMCPKYEKPITSGEDRK